MTIKSAPTPKAFANEWTKGFAVAVRDAAGKDGRLSKNEAAKIAEHGDALARYADNAVNYLASTGQKSVSAEKLIGKGHNYAYAVGAKVAGPGNRISLLEARSLPDDIRPDFFALRGKEDPGAIAAVADKLTGTKLASALEGAATMGDGTVLTYMSEADYPVLPVSANLPAGGLTADGVFKAFEDELLDGLFEDVDNVDVELAAEMYDASESSDILKDLASPYDGADDYVLDLAAGFSRVKDVLEHNLSDVRVVKVGPQAADGSLATDNGLYAYFLVGKTDDGKLAGVMYGAVET